MKKKILVIGAAGMAGHMVCLYLRNTHKYQVHATAYKNRFPQDAIVLDVHDVGLLNETLRRIKPDFVVNCVGALIKESRESPKNAIFLNSYFPYVLKQSADDIGAKVIFLSTDCVFSGLKGSYDESDVRDADDIYGRTKALGEVEGAGHVVLRTSIVGPELKESGEGLLNWFMLQNGTIRGFTNAKWSGITTLELAKAIEKVIDGNLDGLYHVTNGIAISKFDLLTLFKEFFPSNVAAIERYAEYVVDKSLHKSKRFDFEVPTYETMLSELMSFLRANIISYETALRATVQ